MHMSVLNTKTLSPGALLPTSPSVDPNVSTTGTENASLMAARASARSVSLVEEMTSGVTCSRPACCSAASCASTEG
jgi:hypothetical protein